MVKREDIGSNDIVSLYLDTFHDRQRAYVFQVNPWPFSATESRLKARAKPDYSYDTRWRSEGRLTSNGYVVWTAVPFKSLRFPADPAQAWGIALSRSTERLSEDSFWPYVTRRLEGFAQQMAVLDGIRNVSAAATLSLFHTERSQARAFWKPSHQRTAERTTLAAASIPRSF